MEMHTGRAADDTSLLVDRFEELADNQRYALDPLHLLLCTKQFPSQVVGLIKDILL